MTKPPCRERAHDEALTLDDLNRRIAVILSDASKEQRMSAVERVMKALNLNIHDWVSLW